MVSYGRVLLGIAVTAAGTLGAPGAVALATPTVVRVGGPSDTADSKIAIVGSDRSRKGAGFQVTLGTRTVLRGKLRAARGSPAPWAHAYRADLSALEDPGSYRVRAGGTVSRRGS